MGGSSCIIRQESDAISCSHEQRSAQPHGTIILRRDGRVIPAFPSVVCTMHERCGQLPWADICFISYGLEGLYRNESDNLARTSYLLMPFALDVVTAPYVCMAVVLAAALMADGVGCAADTCHCDKPKPIDPPQLSQGPHAA